jgi:hypothetical protein
LHGRVSSEIAESRMRDLHLISPSKQVRLGEITILVTLSLINSAALKIRNGDAGAWQSRSRCIANGAGDIAGYGLRECPGSKE